MEITGIVAFLTQKLYAVNNKYKQKITMRVNNPHNIEGFQQNTDKTQKIKHEDRKEFIQFQPSSVESNEQGNCSLNLHIFIWKKLGETTNLVPCDCSSSSLGWISFVFTDLQFFFIT